MDPARALELIARNPTEEILTKERLEEYLSEGVRLKHYIGYEVSGFVHLGTGPLCMRKVADFQQAGVETCIFLADYHSWINRKLGGDLDTIRRVAGGYFKEALRWSLKSVGGDPDKVRFVLGSELYDKLGLRYLESLIRVSMKLSLSRAKRSITILGRRKGDSVSFAQLLYVPMQVADIYGLEVNLPHGGMDQRKAHVIALEVWKSFSYRPVAVHNHLLMGMYLTGEQRRQIMEARQRGDRELFDEGLMEAKMSKSKPESAIFIHETEEEIRRKLRRAFCPAGETEFNPVIDILRYIIWPYLEQTGRPFRVVNLKTKKEQVYGNRGELEESYMRGELHPLDLKEAVATHLSDILAPARKYFLEGKGRKYLEELQEIRITR